MMLPILFNLCTLVYIALALDGPNVCVEEKEYPVSVKVPAKIPVEVTTFKWCLKVPPRCKVTKIAYREGYKEEIHYEKNRTRVCCKGYAEARNKCVPVCSNPCLHGVCKSPERCDCEPGWAGTNCDITCPKGKKGKNCDEPCLCKNDARCDPISGECVCRPGWTGDDCSQSCPQGFHGFRCLEECRCQNDAECDPTTGRCKCQLGWKGQFCQIECSGNKLDEECVQGCYCDHGGHCNTTTGLCRCPPGYTGDYCSEHCPTGTYGLNCAHRCDCDYGDTNEQVFCDHVTGCKTWSSAPLKIEEPNYASTTLILLVGMIIIVLCISGFLILKYRRELRQLNNELAFVTYISSRKESNDRFDNPLYAHQGTDSKPSKPTMAISTATQVKNNLLNLNNDLSNICKNNLDKVNHVSSSNDFIKGASGQSGGGGYDDLKTTKRDYSPNIYQKTDNFTLPSTKKEPLYAEIPGNDLDPGDNEKESQYDSPRPVEDLEKPTNFRQ